MSKKSKTPEALARVIMERHAAQIAHTEELLRVKREVPVENQADHVRAKTEAEIVAFTNGYSACLEQVMHEFNCYAGFHWFGPKDADGGRRVVSSESPDYLEWRRLYYTNGIAK